MTKSGSVDAIAWMREEIKSDPELGRRVDESYRNLRLGYQVQVLRENAKLTQVQLAEMIGTSQPSIARIESGTYNRVSLNTLLKISEVLGLELEVSFRKVKGRKSQKKVRTYNLLRD